MEVVLRCALADRPGALAALAGAVGACGGDIQSVEVLDHDDGSVVDDLVVVIEPPGLRALVDHLAAMEGVEVVHTGPSRGGAGDAVQRLAVGFEALLDASMPPDRALTTLVGGLLRAADVALVGPGETTKPGRRTLVVPLDDTGSALVARRDYPFTRTERERATAIVRACRAATAAAPPRVPGERGG